MPTEARLHRVLAKTGSLFQGSRFPSRRLTACVASPHGIDSLGIQEGEGVKTMERRGVENRETRETIRHAVTNERARGNAGCGRSGGEALGNLVERTTETTKRERDRDESYFSCGGP